MNLAHSILGHLTGAIQGIETKQNDNWDYPQGIASLYGMLNVARARIADKYDTNWHDTELVVQHQIVQYPFAVIMLDNSRYNKQRSFVVFQWMDNQWTAIRTVSYPNTDESIESMMQRLLLDQLATHN